MKGHLLPIATIRDASPIFSVQNPHPVPATLTVTRGLSPRMQSPSGSDRMRTRTNPITVHKTPSPPFSSPPHRDVQTPDDKVAPFTMLKPPRHASSPSL